MAVKKDFLNPKSMLTPGIAGGIVMMISNTLLMQFDLPARWTALGLSALLGLVVFVAVAIPLWQRLIYYIFNVLIIFCFAVGSNRIGLTASQLKSPSAYRYEINGLDPKALKLILSDLVEAQHSLNAADLTDDFALLQAYDYLRVQFLLNQKLTLEVSTEASRPRRFFSNWF
jgi:hypothetical protein